MIVINKILQLVYVVTSFKKNYFQFNLNLILERKAPKGF